MLFSLNFAVFVGKGKLFKGFCVSERSSTPSNLPLSHIAKRESIFMPGM